jgi:hypothetical protein
MSDSIRDYFEATRPHRNGSTASAALGDAWPEDRRGDAWEPAPNEEEAQAAEKEGVSSSSSFEYQRDWPEPLDDSAFHGLAGQIVRAIEPHTEADPVALLVQLLAAFGNMISRTAHFRAEGHAHYLNLFAVLVGRTSKGRKGSSWGRVRQYLTPAAPEWLTTRVMGGLASGEGMVYAIRDPVTKREPVKRGGRIESYQEIVVDHGVEDKRLFLIEEEYAGVLRLLERQGNSLSQRIREAWQGTPVGSLTKNAQTRCNEPHISIVGHVTGEEVERYLTTSEMANGFGNRHLWFCVKRSKCLPDESYHAPDQELVERFKETIAFAPRAGELRRDSQARELWHKLYPELSEGKPGMTGAMLGRAEAQVMRLACIYAVLDLSSIIRTEHLRAALALWKYSEQSVRFVFGDSTGDPVADDVLKALKNAPNGLTRSEISAFLGRNQPTGRIGKALSLLLTHGLAQFTRESTRGAPAERWQATKQTK